MYAHAHGVASAGCISAFKIMKLLPSERGEMLARYGFWGGGRGSRKVCFCDFKNMYGCIYTSQGSCVAKSFKTRRGSTPQSKKNICGNTLRMSSRGKKYIKIQVLHIVWSAEDCF